MRVTRHAALAASLGILAFTLGGITPAHAASEHSIKVVNGAPFKGTKFALGAFRVAFLTEDEVVSVGKGSWVTGGSSSSASMSGSLEGLDHATMQRLADAVYADFLKQAEARGIIFTDSVHLAATAPSYKALPHADNFEQSRMGTVVIPTGQTSVALAEDGSVKADKGSKGLFARLKEKGASDFGTADANKAFPAAAKEAGMPVLGVTIVVNFANFKGGDGSFGHSKTNMETGATIDGNGKQEMLRNTSIVGWAANTASCAMCMGQLLLQGTIHSPDSIGTVESGKTSKRLDTGLGLGSPSHSSASKAVTVTVDLPAYEKSVLHVAAEANAAMLADLGTH